MMAFLLLFLMQNRSVYLGLSMSELAATVHNRGPNATDTGGTTGGGNARTNWVMRWPHIIGSGDRDKIRLSWDNWWGDASTNTELNTGNPYTIIEMIAELNSAFIPTLFAGSPSKTLNDGDYKITSDYLYPAQFGLTKFTVGDIIWTKGYGSVPSGGKMPSTARFTSDMSGSQFAWYSPVDTTISSTATTGVFTATGTAFLSRTAGPCPIVLGTFVGADKPARMIKGDSIPQGWGQTSGFRTGRGYVQRAQVDADGFSNPMASINLSVYGCSAQLFISDPRIQAYDVNATSVLFPIGTNNFSSSGTGITPANMLILIKQLRDAAIANGITRVAAQQIGVRASSSNNWADEPLQTTATNWGPGGPIDLYNQSLATAGFTMIFPNDSCRGVDRFKWLTNGTNNYTAYDVVHPSGGGHDLKAIEVRPLFALLDQAGRQASVSSTVLLMM